jgi:hypothetical protein
MFDHTTATYDQLIDHHLYLKRMLDWFYDKHGHDPAYLAASSKVINHKKKDFSLTSFAINMKIARAIKTGVNPT